MTSLPLSVLMPVYNGEKYLKEAVDSILSQTFCDYEFIIINDGSTDNSEDILTRIARRDKRVQIISRGNTGYSAALNEGLAKSRGKYIARMDADDLSLPERFLRQVDFLDNHLEYVAVGSRVMLVDPEGLPIKTFSKLVNHDDIDTAHLNKEGGAICHPAVMFRRDAVEKIGGYRTHLEPAEDIDLFLRLAEIGLIANLPEVLLNYRMHAKSVGHTRKEKQVENRNIAVAEAYRRRGLSNPVLSCAKLTTQHTIGELHQKWAWWALSEGNLITARKHAMLAIKRNPKSLNSWKAFACSLREQVTRCN
jgi:glycosyltransferase involved in cell wall biosynthesis